MVITQAEFNARYGAGRGAVVEKKMAASPDCDVRVLTALIDYFRCKRVLEIGCNFGGTAAACLKGGDSIEQYVGIDLPKIWFHDKPAGELALGDPRFEVIQLPNGSRDVKPDELGLFDFIFIDAAHDYASVKFDTELARQMLAPGGVIAWHDYQHPGNPDVKKYIHEVNTNRFQPIVYVEKTWVCYQTSLLPERMAVYTAISGGYDDLCQPKFITPGVDYICFSDKPIKKAGIWQVKPLPAIPKQDDPTRRARQAKILAHKFLPEYDYSVYVDGNATIKGDIVGLAWEHLQKRKIAMLQHPEGRSGAISEAEACITCNKDTPEVIQRQIDAYRASGAPSDTPVPLSSFIAREHNHPNIVNLMESWWVEIMEHSRRDQVSFPFVAWKYRAAFESIHVDPSNNPFVSFREHTGKPVFTKYKPAAQADQEIKSDASHTEKQTRSRRLLGKNQAQKSKTKPDAAGCL